MKRITFLKSLAFSPGIIGGFLTTEKSDSKLKIESPINETVLKTENESIKEWLDTSDLRAVFNNRVFHPEKHKYESGTVYFKLISSLKPPCSRDEKGCYYQNLLQIIHYQKTDSYHLTMCIRNQWTKDILIQSKAQLESLCLEFNQESRKQP